MVECNKSTSIFVLGLASSMMTDIRLSPTNEQSKMEFGYAFCVTFLVFISFISNMLTILTFIRQKLRQTPTGIYIICYSIYSPIGMLMLQFRLIQFIDWLSYTSFVFICNVVSGLASVLTRQCVWMTGLIALQRSLEAKGIGKRVSGTRRSSICQIFALSLVIVIMHIHEFYSRVSLPDPIAPGKWICEILYTPSLNILNTVLAFLHLLFPFFLNLLANSFIIRTVVSRKLHLQSETNSFTFYQMCKKQLKRHRDLFIAPTLSIVCMLPQLILSLNYSCIDLREKWLLRLNTSANLIIYLPQTLTFLIYVYPSTLYYNEFQLQIKRIRRYFGIEKDTLISNRKEKKTFATLKIRNHSSPVDQKLAVPTISSNKKRNKTLETAFTSF
ncbi:unnamed protein product [Adineta steineri]|uniref:G-protein coupled receptors family 1 profile domain-containing protein n=1 Tax=Adineta steineri TaxID=433720 RepID=A0A816DAW8_9BILA|nr:unnamed protein product [Adineta steineri]CAF1631802.1 unnamed protein product [Adineta steineri]